MLPGFVVQFGLAADPNAAVSVSTDNIKDDKVIESNLKGTITFATTLTGVSVNLGTGTDALVLANVANTGTVSNTETITGGTGADTIVANNGEAALSRLSLATSTKLTAMISAMD